MVLHTRGTAMHRGGAPSHCAPREGAPPGGASGVGVSRASIEKAWHDVSLYEKPHKSLTAYSRVP